MNAPVFARSAYRARRFRLLDLCGHFYVQRTLRGYLWQRLVVTPFCALLALV